MSLDPLKKAVAKLEREAIRMAALIAAQGTLRTDLSSDELERLTGAFPAPEAAHRFLTGMPKKPGAKAILAKFDDPKKLATLVNGTLGGDMRALGVLAEKGCGGDAGKLKDFADTFEGNADFKVMFEQGGMAKRPESLAALLDGACGGSAAELAKIVDKFKDPGDAAKLDKALGAGGLGAAPEALGGLAKGDDGALLKQLTEDITSDDDLTRLATMLGEGGLDGRAPGRPELLRDVISKGLGGDPGRLKELHDGFHSAPGVNPAISQMDQFGRMIDAFDGDDGKAGERLKSAMDTFLHHGAADTAEAALRLRDPFMSSLETMGRANGTPMLTEGAADRAAEAAMKVPVPTPASVAAAMTGLLAPGADTALPPDGMALLLGPVGADLVNAPDVLAGAADQVEKAAPPVAVEDGHSEETGKQTAALEEATKKVLAEPQGPELSKLTELEEKSAALLERATREPAGETRTKAIDAAKAAAAAIKVALARIAAERMGETGAAGAAAMQVAEVGKLRAGASQAEKDALEALGKATMMAAAAAASAGNATPADTAQAAQDDVALLPDLEQADETKRRNEECDAAAGAATEAAAEIGKAPAPVDPAFVARVAALAAAAATAGRAAPDQTRAQAAFDAAVLAAEAAAAAARRTAAASAVAAAHDNTDAAKALAAGSDCDQAIANLTKAGLGAEALDVGKAAAAARAGSAAIVAGVQMQTDPEAGKKAREATERETADPVNLTKNIKMNEGAAHLAGEAAKTAGELLSHMDVSDVDFIATIEDTETKAQEALKLARLAVDDTIRNRVITQATTALRHVTAKAAEYAEEQIKAANTELKTRQRTASTQATTARNALLDDHIAASGHATFTDDGSALAARAEGLRNAVADTSRSLLAEGLMNDAAASSARDDAAKAAAAAAVPGAGPLKRVEAAVALREANKAMADVGFALAATHIGNLPPAPSGAATTPLTTDTNGMKPEVAFRTAAAAFEAANSAAAKWTESARAARAAIRVALAEIDTTHPDHGTINGMIAAADTEIDSAVDKQRDLDPSVNTSLIWILNDRAQRWATWINAQGHAGRADAQDVQSSFAVIKAQRTETRKGSDHVGVTREELIRCAASIKMDPYGVGGTNATEPCAITVGSGGGATTENAKIRKQHICGRHVREAFEFGHVDGGPTPTDVAAGHMIAAAWEGRPQASLPAGPNKLLTLRKESKAQKVNSFLPEEVTKANVTAVVEKALNIVRAGYPDAPTFHAAITNPPANGFLKIDPVVDIPPPARLIIGIKLDGGQPKADMVHGTKVTMTMPDMMAIGRAIQH